MTQAKALKAELEEAKKNSGAAPASDAANPWKDAAERAMTQAKALKAEL
eukprot:CAMPEP_0169289796 /NCGR_PEP_ID=MMETSP1016-20121227/61351_1 /TAXON_ID=342587 /ORGANISM="Karlodinium micrum, Strain CCMP2283" /LENGTH=48 /DNA_ID= /DNA_START= /DNA_END= /DNA_ORIENTATION=